MNHFFTQLHWVAQNILIRNLKDSIVELRHRQRELQPPYKKERWNLLSDREYEIFRKSRFLNQLFLHFGEGDQFA